MTRYDAPGYLVCWEAVGFYIPSLWLVLTAGTTTRETKTLLLQAGSQPADLEACFLCPIRNRRIKNNNNNNNNNKTVQSIRTTTALDTCLEGFVQCLHKKQGYAEGWRRAKHARFWYKILSAYCCSVYRIHSSDDGIQISACHILIKTVIIIAGTYGIPGIWYGISGTHWKHFPLVATSELQFDYFPGFLFFVFVFFACFIFFTEVFLPLQSYWSLSWDHGLHYIVS